MTPPASTVDDDLERNLAAARRLSTTAAVPPAVVLGLVVLVVGLLVGMPPLLLVVLLVLVVPAWAVAAAVNLRTHSARLVRAAVGGRRLTGEQEPRLHNLVEGLCVGIGLEAPALWLVDDPAANALAVARSVDEADLVVTTGLLERLSRVELEAVLAHELARVRRGDAVVGALAATTLGGTGLLKGGDPLATIALGPSLLAAPLTRALTAKGEPVETWPDLAAVEITRYPPALASALEVMAAHPGPAAASHPLVAHLWALGPGPEGAFGEAVRRVYDPDGPVEQRIEVLQEL